MSHRCVASPSISRHATADANGHTLPSTAHTFPTSGPAPTADCGDVLRSRWTTLRHLSSAIHRFTRPSTVGRGDQQLGR